MRRDEGGVAAICRGVGDASSTTPMDVVKVGLEKQIGLELEIEVI